MPKPELPATKLPPDEFYFREAERWRWNTERDIPWQSIDAQLALRQPEILEKLRRATLIEAYHPANITRELPPLLDDPMATLVLCTEMFEGTRHYYVLKRYLDTVGYQPGITLADIQTVRLSDGSSEVTGGTTLHWLVNFMGSEHYAAFFFFALSEQAEEPVLKRLLRFIGRDEVRHARAVCRVIEAKVGSDPALRQEVLAAAAEFRHYGLDVVDEVPVSDDDELAAMAAFLRRIRRICGRGVTDYLRESKATPGGNNGNR